MPERKAFCLFGGPGIGKSAIACHWSHARKDVIAFHHCRYGDASKTDPKQIVVSLTAQIAEHLPEYQRWVSGLKPTEFEDLVKGDAGAILQNLLGKPLGSFRVPEHRKR